GVQDLAAAQALEVFVERTGSDGAGDELGALEFLFGHGAEGLGGGGDVGGEEDEQFGFGADDVAAFEGFAEDGDVAEEGDLGEGLGPAVFHEAADDDGVAGGDGDAGLGGSFGEDGGLDVFGDGDGGAGEGGDFGG